MSQDPKKRGNRSRGAALRRTGPAVLLAMVVCLCCCGISRGQVSATYSIRVDGRRVVGTPIVWDREKLILLSGYGQFAEVRMNAVDSFEKTSRQRLVYDPGEFSRSLQQEFGNSYQVSRTRDYVVVHPVGPSVYWPQKIQYMHDAFRNYFLSRRIAIERRIYPLVAVVFSNRSEFLQHARESGDRIHRNTIGYYSPSSNRVLIYDRSGEGRMTGDNLSTIIHEVAHQSAFNCGIHRRFSDTPGWIVEGLGTMFEAKGVFDSFQNPEQAARINQPMRNSFFRTMAERNWRGWLEKLVTGDEEFAGNPERYYSCAWAMTFFLVETQPHQYTKYLEAMNGLPLFRKYPQAKRTGDFEAAFGRMDLVEGAVRNYFSGLSE